MCEPHCSLNPPPDAAMCLSACLVCLQAFKAKNPLQKVDLAHAHCLPSHGGGYFCIPNALLSAHSSLSRSCGVCFLSCQVPVLETPQGCLFESNAIARYVARLGGANLLGGSAFAAGQVDQWVDFCNNELEPARGIWLYPIMGYLAYNEKAYTEAKKEMTRVLTALNDHLLNNTFLVGNAVTLADIVIVSSLGQKQCSRRNEARRSATAQWRRRGLHLVRC